MLPLILGSSSPYRRELLSRLNLPFSCASPNINETPQPNESAEQLVLRLATEKAHALKSQYPKHLIIGSDQAAVLDEQILGKPGTHSQAFTQLKAASGKKLSFLTALTLLNTQTGQQQSACIPFSVYFRSLSNDSIERYLQHEQPYDCAGSFKAEGLGISLFEKMEGDDNTSLIGLPLITLINMLQKEGLQIP